MVPTVDPASDAAAGTAAAANSQGDRTAAFLDRALVLADVVVFHIDLQRQRIHYNEVGFKAFGRPPDPAGISLTDLVATVHPDDVARLERANQQAMASTGVVDLEARYRFGDGTWHHQLTRRVAERDSQGRVVGIAGVAISIDELQRQRDTYRALNERTGLAVQALGAGFWNLRTGAGDVRDADSAQVSGSRRLTWDEQMLRIYDRSSEQTPAGVRQWIEQCLHPEDQAWCLRRLMQAQETRDSMIEIRYRIITGGHSRPPEVRWVNAWRYSRKLDGERVWFGMQMDVTHSHLAQQQQLADQAAAAALADEKRRLEQRSRDKSAFMARMSHELRTPLNAVLGFSQLLLDDAQQPLNPRQQERLRMISNSGRQLLGLIDDLLDLSRQEPAPALPSSVAVAAAQTVVLPAPSGPAEPVPRDTGLAPRSSAGQVGSLDGLDGRDVRSEVSSDGSSDGSSGISHLSRPNPPPDDAPLPMLQVLCVEDNPVNLMLVREVLALRPQVRLRWAEDGSSGLAEARRETPDVVLLDMQLPDLTGLEVMQRLRQQPATANCHIVALSADALPESIDEARRAGFDDYWTKPIEFKGFLAGIDRLVLSLGH